MSCMMRIPRTARRVARNATIQGPMAACFAKNPFGWNRLLKASVHARPATVPSAVVMVVLNMVGMASKRGGAGVSVAVMVGGAVVVGGGVVGFSVSVGASV